MTSRKSLRHRSRTRGDAPVFRRPVGKRGVYLALAAIILGFGGEAASDPLIGDVKSTVATPEGAVDNPAMAAMVPGTAVQIAPTVFESNKLTVRYPGFEPVERPKSGLGDPQSFIPAAVYRVGNFAFGIAQILPPISTQIKVEQAPIVILGQQSLVDLNINAKVRGGFSGILAWRMARSFSLGAKLSYQSIGVDLTIVPSGTTNELASVILDTTTTSLVIGGFMDIIDDRFGVGLAAEVLRTTTIRNEVKAALLGGGEGAGNGGGDKKGGDAATQSSMPMASILGGAYLNTGRARLHVDLMYTRANQEQKEFSLVELKEKTKELYDTVTFRAGAKIKALSRGSILFGGRYETASIGEGGRGSDSLSGYGATDLIQVYAGQAQLKPYYAVAGGAEFSLGQRRRPEARKSPKKKAKDKESRVGKEEKAEKSEAPYSRPPEKPFVVAFGIGYAAASLGISEKGEQPAAYTQTRIFFPLNVIYYF